MRLRALTLDRIDMLDEACKLADRWPGLWYAVVFDLASSPSDYLDACLRLKTHGAKILGAPFDSTAEKQIVSLKTRRARLREWFPKMRPGVDMWEVGNEWNLPELARSRMYERMGDAVQYVKDQGGKTCITTYFTPDDLDKMWGAMAGYAKKQPNGQPDFCAFSVYPNWNGRPDSWQSIVQTAAAIWDKSEWIGIREYGIEPFGTDDDKDESGNKIKRTTQEIEGEQRAIVTEFEALQVFHPKWVGFGGYWDAVRDVLGGGPLESTFMEVWK